MSTLGMRGKKIIDFDTMSFPKAYGQLSSLQHKVAEKEEYIHK